MNNTPDRPTAAERVANHRATKKRFQAEVLTPCRNGLEAALSQMDDKTVRFIDILVNGADFSDLGTNTVSRLAADILDSTMPRYCDEVLFDEYKQHASNLLRDFVEIEWPPTP